MNKLDYFEKIKALLVETNSDIELISKTDELMAQETQIQARKEKASKEKKKADSEFFELVEEMLTDKPIFARDVSMVLGCSSQKASYLLQHLESSGRASSVELLVKPRGTRRGSVKKVPSNF
jgi:Fic family protein